MPDAVATLETTRPAAVSPVDRGIEAYLARCRGRIPSFVERNFSLKQTWSLQRRTLWFDLACAPINTAWALPHVAIQKVADTLARVGYLRVAQWAKSIPPGIKTGYQTQIERLICRDLLEWDREGAPAALPQGFLRELEALPVLQKGIDPKPARKLVELLQQFSSGRAAVSDLAGTLLTVALSWSFFGSANEGLRGIAYGVAKHAAHERAASRFFLGKKAGSHFYNVFPPQVPESRVWMVLAFLVVGLAVGAMACTILSDPLRKVLGFHRNRLEFLLDEMERELIVLTHKAVTASKQC